MGFFVPLTECTENLLKDARLVFRNVLLAEVDTERTRCGTIKADDIGLR